MLTNVLCLITTLIFAQIPSTEIYVQSAEELAAVEYRVNALGDEIRRIEGNIEDLKEELENGGEADLLKQIDALQAELDAVNEKMGEEIAHPDPMFHAYFPEYLERLELIESLHPDPKEPMSPDTVNVLADELYAEQGHPSLNYRVHVIVMAEMNEASTHPSISQESMKVMRDRLILYYEEGGGISSPLMETELASTLFRVSEPTDTKARQIVATLCSDAQSWCQQLGRYDEYAPRFKDLYKHFEASDELRKIEKVFVRTSSATTQPVIDPRQARKEFDLLIRRFNWDVSKIQRVYVITTATYKDKNLQHEFMHRLLTTYYRILRKDTGVSKEVIQAIETHLLKIAKGNRLETERLWQLWVRAILTMKNDISPELREYILSENIETKSKIVSKPMVKRSLKRLRSCLSR